LYSAVRMPSFQTAGMWPVLQTFVKIACRAVDTGPIAHAGGP